jgi:hypothetical protein
MEPKVMMHTWMSQTPLGTDVSSGVLLEQVKQKVKDLDAHSQHFIFV